MTLHKKDTSALTLENFSQDVNDAQCCVDDGTEDVASVADEFVVVEGSGGGGGIGGNGGSTPSIEIEHKKVNHHARALFDRARAFALQGSQEIEYLEQHPLLANVPGEYKLWIISKVEIFKSQLCSVIWEIPGN